MLDEVPEDLERDRLETDRLAVAPERAVPYVQLEASEPVDHPVQESRQKTVTYRDVTPDLETGAIRSESRYTAAANRIQSWYKRTVASFLVTMRGQTSSRARSQCWIT